MKRAFFALTVPLLLTACPKEREEPLTRAEAQQALEEAQTASQAEGLTSASVEIMTNFTIGQGVEQAAQQLAAFVASQLPCAEITLDGASLTVKYGVNPGTCTYRGQTFTGTTGLTVSRNDEGEVIVEHEWDELSNGQVSVTGSATVTWNFQEQTRHVEHETTWTNLSNGRTAQGFGDRTQSALPGGLLEGISVDGSRSWVVPSGRWDLSIEGVQMRWVDPVPQSGSYVLATPFDKTVSLDFSRRDADTITVTVASGDRSFSFDVTALASAAEG